MLQVVHDSMLLGVDVGMALRKTDCIGFGKYASLFAFVAVRQWLRLPTELSVFLRLQLTGSFLFLEWRTAIYLFLLDFNIAFCNLR